MKKIFTAISSVIVCLIIIFMVVLCFWKTNIPISFGSPYSVLVYNKSTASSGKEYYSDKYEGYLSSSNTQTYYEILNKLNTITNVSIFNRLMNNGLVNDKVEIDLDEKYVSFSTDLMQSYICVELIFSYEQDMVVYYNGNSRVISYYAIMYLIPDSSDYGEILVYYSTSSSEYSARREAYASASPIVLYGISTDFVEYVQTL